MEGSSNKKNHVILRGFNWFLAILIFSGAVLFLIKGASSGGYAILGGLFVLALSVNYFGSAIVINPNLTTILGYPVVVGNKIRISLMVSNSVLALFGIVVIAACIFTQQYPASISGILYLAISGFNVFALKKVKA